MRTLEIKTANAIKAYNAASKEGRIVLETLFGQKIFSSITDRIKTFDDVLGEFGMSKDDFEDYTENHTKDEVAYRKLKMIIQVLNEGWKPDFTDHTQYKYYPWFDVNAAGSAYVATHTAPSTSFAYIGSRLCLKTRELAIYAGRTFQDIYNDYLL